MSQARVSGTDPIESGSRAYDSDDLDWLDAVIDSVLEELSLADGDPLTPASRLELRNRFAAAVFRCTQADERDYAALRQRLLETLQVPAPPASI
jgi:hypothetical protein